MAYAAAGGFDSGAHESTPRNWNFLRKSRTLLGIAAAVVTIVGGWNEMFPPSPETVYVEVPTPVAPTPTQSEWPSDETDYGRY